MPWFAVLVPVVLLVGLGFWLYRRVAHTPQLGRRGKVATLVGIVVLFGVTLVAASTTRVIADPKAWRPVTWSGYVVMGLVFYVILAILAIQVVHGLWRLVDRLRHRTPDRAPRLRRLTAAGLVLALVTTAYGVMEADRPSTTPVTIVSADLPQAFDGYRVALITDLHVGPTRGRAFTQRVVDMVNAEKPDLIVLGGDMIDGSVAGLGDELAPLATLRATDGVVATTGNHEFYYDAADWVAEWRRQGLAVLDNDARIITRGGASIDVLGINDYSGTGALRPDLDAAVNRLVALGGSASDRGRFRLLVASAAPGDGRLGRHGGLVRDRPPGLRPHARRTDVALPVPGQAAAAGRRGVRGRRGCAGLHIARRRRLGTSRPRRRTTGGADHHPASRLTDGPALRDATALERSGSSGNRIGADAPERSGSSGNRTRALPPPRNTRPEGGSNSVYGDLCHVNAWREGNLCTVKRNGVSTSLSQAGATTISLDGAAGVRVPAKTPATAYALSLPLSAEVSWPGYSANALLTSISVTSSRVACDHLGDRSLSTSWARTPSSKSAWWAKYVART